MFCAVYAELAFMNAAFACIKAAVTVELEPAALAASYAACVNNIVERGLPPAVTPSCMISVCLVVSTVISATAPVNMAVCAVLPLLNCSCVGIL